MPKGQKTCNKCGTSTGPRSFTCPKCNNPFKCESTHKVNKPITNEPVVNNIPLTSLEEKTINLKNVAIKKTEGLLAVLVPGSSNKNEPFCPFTPKSLTDEDKIKEWIISLRDYRFPCCGKIAYYTDEAIHYFAQEFWPEHMITGDGIEPHPMKKRVFEMIEQFVERHPNSIRNFIEKN